MELEGNAQGSLDLRRVSSGQQSKGKEREICCQESEREPGSEYAVSFTTEAVKDPEIIFRGPNYSDRVALFASNFSFDQNGDLVIFLHIAPRESPDTQARISMFWSDYKQLCLQSCSQQTYDSQSVGLVRLSPPIEIGALLRTFQLQLPADHEYLKDFELLSAPGRLSCLDDYLARKGIFCLDREHALNFTIPEILILLKEQRINIVEYAENGWVVNEQYSALFDHARMKYCEYKPHLRRTLRDFCEGAGPSDYTSYSKRYVDGVIAKYKESNEKQGNNLPLTLDPCWKAFVEGKSESSPDALMAGDEDVAVPREEKEEGEGEGVGRRKSFREKLVGILPWMKGEEKKLDKQTSPFGLDIDGGKAAKRLKRSSRGGGEDDRKKSSARRVDSMLTE